MSTNLKQLTLSKYIETLLATIEITNNKTINEILYQLKFIDENHFQPAKWH